MQTSLVDLNLADLKKNTAHFPVLIREIITELVEESSNKTYVDCTFGAGGYSRFILENTRANVVAIDRDLSVIKFAKPLLEQYPKRFKFFNNTFSNISEVVKEAELDKIDAVIADLGVSSMQLGNSERGFSVKRDGPLSMQMGFSTMSAYDFVNSAKEEEIAEVLLEFGEETRCNKIAKAIVMARNKSKISTTNELKIIVNHAVGNKGKTESATKTFQAIRIFVNNELEEIKIILNNSVELLNHGGKLMVVSFHSLEDRLVKLFFNEISGKFNEDSSKFTIFKPKTANINFKFKILTKKVITPKFDEVRVNRNSRGAKLRIAVKL